MPLDYTAIERILPHRYPFLLIDRIVEYVENKRVVGIKNVTFNEPQFNTQDGYIGFMLDFFRQLRGQGKLVFLCLHPNEPMIELMRETKTRGYRMALLTNNVREWEPLWRPFLPVDEIFETVTLLRFEQQAGG